MSNFFWTDARLEPKRQYRFVVTIVGADPAGASYYAKKVNKPSLEIGEGEHKYLQHTFYYPTKPTWNTVTCTLVDPVNPDMAQNLSSIVEASGYVIPTNGNQLTTMSKAAAVTNLGSVFIDQYDESHSPDGTGLLLESWELKNAWIKRIDFGELDYESEELSNIEIEFRYDWAQLVTNQPSTASPSGQNVQNVFAKQLNKRFSQGS